MPAVLLSAFISYIAGYLGTGFAPLWMAIPFLMIFPAVLFGVLSFRISAFAVSALLCWDVVAATWPHITLAGFMSSIIDELSLGTTILVVLTACLSPFRSGRSFFRHVRDM
jgi:hypothetical protein